MNEKALASSIKQVVIVLIVVAGITVNTMLLKGAGNSSDILTTQESVELHKEQTDKLIRQNVSYLEKRIAKAEERQDAYYNSLNRKVDIVENKLLRFSENQMGKTIVNNTFAPAQTTIVNLEQKERDEKQ